MVTHATRDATAPSILIVDDALDTALFVKTILRLWPRTLLHRGTIELPVSFIQSVGDAVVLSIDVAKLREAHRSPERDVALPPST